jgi:hypothetical protein
MALLAICAIFVYGLSQFLFTKLHSVNPTHLAQEQFFHHWHFCILADHTKFAMVTIEDAYFSVLAITISLSLMYRSAAFISFFKPDVYGPMNTT